jgi:hypothetical protein
LLGLGKIAEHKKDYDEALKYYKLADDRAEKKSSQDKEAKAAIANLKKIKREQRRRR